MRAAIYARYSTDKQRQSSVEDQNRNCQRFAEREGWKVVAKYADRGISGATSARPEYQRMLADAEAKKFDVLIVDDLSRLARDDIEQKQTIRRFRFRGLRIVGVSDGFDSAAKGFKIVAGVRGLINDIFLDDLRDKTLRGMEGQARKGHNVGGRSYGYKHTPVTDPQRTDEFGRPAIVAVKREIDPEQAAVVRQIFKWFADGWSARAIAAELNKRKVPPPRKRPKTASPSRATWCCSAITGQANYGTGLVNNELYIGRFLWNRSAWVKDPDSGVRKRAERPESEWVVKDMPELRIVPQPLWDKVKARQRAQAEAAKAFKARVGKGKRGPGPKYLFSGLLVCDDCGSNFTIIDGAQNYGCAAHRDRGPAACKNGARIPRAVVEDKLLAAIREDLFTPNGVAKFKADLRKRLAAQREDHGKETEANRRALARVEREIARMVQAIKAGVLSASLKAELAQAEAEKARLEAALKVDTTPVDNVVDLLPRVVDRYRDLVANLARVPDKHLSRARNVIRALVGNEVRLRRRPDGGLDAVMRGHYNGFVELLREGAVSPEGRTVRRAGNLAKNNLVAGAGIEPATNGL